MSKQGLIIYGCYGYTGQLISERAVELGMKPTLAGRDAKKTEEIAKRLSLPFLVFSLDSESEIARHIEPFQVMLHCAGPFIFTADKVLAACLETKTHYLDITGEYQVFEKVKSLDAQARESGVLLMSGVGFDVVPSDCLAMHLKSRMPDATSLELALLQKGGRISHGTAMTVVENMGDPTKVRRDGKLVSVPNGAITRNIDYGDKVRPAVAISWGDISTAYSSTGIPNITVYNHISTKVIKSMKWTNYLGFVFRSSFMKNRMKNAIKQRPAGPDEQEREKASSVIWGEVTNAKGEKMTSILNIPEGYTLTALTAVEIARQVLEGNFQAGTHTPASLFGKDFILSFKGVLRIDK